MAKPTVTDEDLRRLEAERAQADVAYNSALTAVDHALVQPVPLPPPPPPPDDQQAQRLNALWEIVPARPVPFGGWRARLGSIVWRILGPIAQRQQEFNSALVDHVNRTLDVDRKIRETSIALLDSVRQEFDLLTRFQTELIKFLQEVTPYVNTKDRQEIGTLRRQTEERAIALGAGLSGAGEELLRRWESIAVDQDEIRLSIAAVQRTAQAMKQELERVTAGCPAAVSPVAAEAPASGPAHAAAESLGARLDSGKYVEFEDKFRGSPADIRSRIREYLPVFEGATDVLDIGCGRGEFLELLAGRGIASRGVDINSAMVDLCRSKGLDVTQGDAVGYLETQADNSVGGLLAVQVVEHLQADEFVRMLELAYRKLRPGARIALETINPACWSAFFSSYIRDISHVHPIHPDTLRHFLIASGFQRVEIRYRAPCPEPDKLQPVPVANLAAVAPALTGLVEAFNGNVARLNALLFTYLDYAAIGEKL